MRRFAAVLALMVFFGTGLVWSEPVPAGSLAAGLDAIRSSTSEQAQDMRRPLGEADNSTAHDTLAQAASPETAAALNHELKAELADAEAARRALQQALTDANEKREALAASAEALAASAEASAAEVSSLREALAAARREIEDLAMSALAANAESAARDEELAQLKAALAAAEAGLPAAKASLTEAAVLAPATATEKTIGDGAGAPEPANLSAGGGAAPADDRLIDRGNALLARGDIASARLFYELALDNGHPRAATIIGQTYDPFYLKQLNAVGVPGEPEKAAAWYRRAIAAGDTSPVNRLKALTAASVN